MLPLIPRSDEVLATSWGMGSASEESQIAGDQTKNQKIRKMLIIEEW